MVETVPTAVPHTAFEPLRPAYEFLEQQLGWRLQLERQDQACYAGDLFGDTKAGHQPREPACVEHDVVVREGDDVRGRRAKSRVPSPTQTRPPLGDVAEAWHVWEAFPEQPGNPR